MKGWGGKPIWRKRAGAVLQEEALGGQRRATSILRAEVPLDPEEEARPRAPEEESREAQETERRRLETQVSMSGPNDPTPDSAPHAHANQAPYRARWTALQARNGPEPRVLLTAWLGDNEPERAWLVTFAKGIGDPILGGQVASLRLAPGP